MSRVGAENVLVRPVPDGDYPEVAADLISDAYRRCLCSIFIVDVDPARDHDLQVNRLLEHLARTTWRGADTRLLIGGSHSNLAIAEASHAARAVAKKLGISARWLSVQVGRGSHVKLVVADDRLLLGSHNWSGGARGGLQRQDSLLILSADLAAYYTAVFDGQWHRAGTT